MRIYMCTYVVTFSYHVSAAVLHLPVSRPHASNADSPVHHNDHAWRHLPIFLMPFSRYDSMDVQDQLVKCTFNDLDVAPAGKLEPDEFDVNPYKVSEGLGFCSCIYYYPPSHIHTRIAIQTDIICLNPQYRCCASIESSTCPIPSIPICVSIHPSNQSNAAMWKKWDKFHRNISPGGSWNSTAWCRDYINVRAYM